MEKICFNNNDEIVDKLKEIGIFTKTKTSKDLENIATLSLEHLLVLEQMKRQPKLLLRS